MSNITPESKERILIGAADAEQNNLVKIFDKREVLGKQFCMYGNPEEPLFLAKDVAGWIEHSNSRSMLDSIDESEKVVRNVYTLGGNQEAWFVTEYGLYEILMQSRKPIAKEFKQKVKEILKSVRKQGYFLAKPLTQLEVLAQTTQVLLHQEKQIQQIESVQAQHTEQIKNIREIVALNPADGWRSQTTELINKMAQKLGGDSQAISNVRSESYTLLCKRFGFNLKKRLANMQDRLTEKGLPKSHIDKLNFLDVIATRKRLIEAYIAIVKEMAVKYGI